MEWEKREWGNGAKPVQGVGWGGRGKVHDVVQVQWIVWLAGAGRGDKDTEPDGEGFDCQVRDLYFIVWAMGNHWEILSKEVV